MASKSRKTSKKRASKIGKGKGEIDPFALTLSVMQTSGTFMHETPPFVASPSKRLMIEFVTVKALIPKGQLLLGNIFTTTNKVFFPQQLNLISQGTFNGQSLFVASQLVVVYVDPGAAINFLFNRNSSAGSVSIDVTFSGRFVGP